MPYLYVDNFRGFTDALIPLEPVTFLVGENSTGKSSVLSLLQMVGDFRFWVTSTFKTTETSLGRFGDIVSANAKNRSYFRVGTLVPEQASGKEAWTPFSTSALLTFINNNGDPQVKFLSLYSRQRIVHFCIDTGELHYRIDPKLYEEPGSLESARTIANAMRDAHQMGRRRQFRKLDVGTRELGHQEVMITVFFRTRELLSKEGLPSDFNANPIEYSSGVRFLAPIRSHPKRTYDEPTKEYSPQGDHVPYLIQEVLQHKGKSDAFLKTLRDAGQGTGLFREIQPKTYGRGTTGPFELDVVLDSKPINILNVGYGVSQSMPIIVEAINAHAGSTFIIQQPEVHLHPRAQAGIGGLLFQLALNENKRFLVETHSDYLIDRFRLMCSRSKQAPRAQVLFFARRAGLNEVTPLPIDHAGNLPASQPEAYREFFVKEELALLGLE